MPYGEVSIVGYNANPPADDGSAVATNEVSWAKHTEKIGDPLKTALESTQTAITSVIDSIETDVAVLEANIIPAGSVMLFRQTTPPSTWTKVTTWDNRALRVVSGTVSTGGTTAFTSVFTSRTILQANLPAVNLSHSLTSATHSHTWSDTSSSDSHSHTWSDTSNSDSHDHDLPNNMVRRVSGGFASSSGNYCESNSSLSTDSDSHSHSVSGTTSSDSHTHTVSGTTSSSGALAVSGTVSLGGSGTAMDFAVQYVDVIFATKD